MPPSASEATRCDDRPDARQGSERGFSLVEILITLVVVSVLAAVAVPGYLAALERARVTRAIGDISALGKEVVTFQVSRGCWPGTLADLGRAGLLDPWGRPYVLAVVATGGGGGGNQGNAGGGGGQGNSGNAGNAGGRGNSGNANGRGNRGNAGTNGNGSANNSGNSGNSGSGSGGSNGGGAGSCGACAAGCVPAGQARQIAGAAVNTDFDLYSVGRDGQTAPSLAAQPSLDDIVRGRSGSFVGLARGY